MAKKNWRDANDSKSKPQVENTGWSDSTDSSSLRSAGGLAGKALMLLISAGILGGLIALYMKFIQPEKITPVLYFKSFARSQGEQLLSTSAFERETADRLADESSNGDLVVTNANLRSMDDAKITASGPESNIAIFYVYADVVVGEHGKPVILADENAIDPSSSLDLGEFLESICKKDLEDGGVEPKGGNQRIVVLDTGRLDESAFSTILPQTVADAVQTAITGLKDGNVPNHQNLWVMLATDNYQLGWSSPELNGSVFGYFFTRGLKGEADGSEPDQVITLAELQTYVRESVARWVNDYRDAVQTPVLLTNSPANASDIKVIFPNNAPISNVVGFENQKTAHDELWRPAFNVPQPHRRQMICSQLVRLEQLRYCESQEYTQLTNQVKTLLNGSDKNFTLRNKEKSSGFDLLSNDQLRTATEPKQIAELKAFLDPNSALTPAEQKKLKAAEQSKSEKEAVDPKTQDETNAAEKSESDEKPIPRKGIPPGLKRLSGPQRLALVWHYLIHQSFSFSEFGQPQLQDSVDLIRLYDATNQECDLLVEMQLLELLDANLPWDQPGFDNALFHNIVRSFDASESLTNGLFNSYSTPGEPQYSPSQFLMNWKHFDASFELLENRRRLALDHAIAGRIGQANSEFAALVKDYGAANERMAMLFGARKTTNDLLFVLPYLNSFNLRESVYRNEPIKDPVEFRLPLSELADLENLAKKMISLLAGPPMDDSQTESLKLLWGRANTGAETIKKRISEIAIELTGIQTASKYAFEGRALLATPIPEWIDEGSGKTTSTRAEILKRLESHLQQQQSAFFQAGSQANQKPLDVDQLATQHLQGSEKWLASFRDFQSRIQADEALVLTENRRPLSRLQQNSNWQQLQIATMKIPSIDDLRNDHSDLDSDTVKLSEATAVLQELQRLDRLDSTIRVSGPGIGLSKALSDTHQQQERLLLFDSERRSLGRAIRDFWGAGDVAKNRNVPPPFMRQVASHGENLKLLAESMESFRLDGKPYKAYDPASLVSLGNQLTAMGASTWQSFSSLRASWIHDGQPVPIDEKRVRIIGEVASNLDLRLDDMNEVLNNPDYFPVQDEPPSQRLGKRMRLDDQTWIEQLEIPLSVENKPADGKLLFRGHVFTGDIRILRKIAAVIPSKTFVFEPQFRPADEALISVVNDVNNKVDVIFLLDCSGSMDDRPDGKKPKAGEKNRMDLLKESTREIMTELARSNRFHIGLAAFGNRGQFRNPAELKDNKYVIAGSIHPFEDWEMIANPPTQVSDESSILELFDQFPKLKPYGLTPLYYSISQTLDKFPNSGRKRVMIVVTDGSNAQVPPNLPDPRTAIPEGKQPTLLADVSKKLNQSNVQVLVLRIATQKDANFQLAAPNKVLELGGEFRTKMRDAIYEFVGRYQFSVKEVSETPTLGDILRMGETARVKVIPKSEYKIQTHGVSNSSSQNLVLFGGEKYDFIFDQEGLRLDYSKSKQVSASFLAPRIDKDVPLANGNYEVGRIQNFQNNIRIGFVNKRGPSQYPGRTWARVRESVEGDGPAREFDLTRPMLEFAEIPTLNFQMPDGNRLQKFDLTLYVKPGLEESSKTEGESETPSYFEFEGESSGEFRGLNYSVKLKPDSRSRFVVEIISDSPIQSAFHLESPNSTPIGKRTLIIRSVTFENTDRVKETFEFEIPESKSPTFRLYVQPKEKFEAAIRDRPAAQDVKKCIDPIFGDEVIAIQFTGIELKK